MTRSKTPYVSNKTSSVKISESSISAHIAAFEKSGGKIEVLGNTPLHGRDAGKHAHGGGDRGTEGGTSS